MLRGSSSPSDFLGIDPNDLKQFQFGGLYGPTTTGGQQMGVPSTAPKMADGAAPASFEPSFIDTGLSSEDFFSPFLNPDFPIDISLPLQLGDGVMQSQAPLMQVAQSQTTTRRNPKLVGKRKLHTAAKSRQQSAGQAQQKQQQQFASLPTGKQGTSAGTSPSSAQQSLSALSAQPLAGLSAHNPCYVDSPLSTDQDLFPDEPKNKRQKRLVKNRQAAQLFRKRQKQYISDLENKVAEVTNKNIALLAKVDVLVTENQLVKDQLKYLRTFVVSALEQAFPPNKYAEMQQQLGGIGLTDSPKKEPVTTSSTSTGATATASTATAASTTTTESP